MCSVWRFFVPETSLSTGGWEGSAISFTNEIRYVAPCLSFINYILLNIWKNSIHGNIKLGFLRASHAIIFAEVNSYSLHITVRLQFRDLETLFFLYLEAIYFMQMTLN